MRDERPLQRDDIERLIDQVAEQVSLAPELIRSVVSVESNFQVQAVSSAGAQGLKQLMPETAQELGVEDSFDPQQNLLGGSRYLKQLLDKYNGDLDKALAAYNWGQGNVDRKGLEQMPRETRNYLTKVKGD
ncbi:lytic transglycosylase domain-containing protein [Malonomonas rubra]|uniref:lytic transglycosylase domain-containing protein n=1 Tax=Malonomonas rubra TaxID=57040 RepID=UPI0026F105F0|nr:lytic transglycosylase domain-containing protein [Malonomonas rubra]